VFLLAVSIVFLILSALSMICCYSGGVHI
jgi:hypothetical protein